MALLKSPPSLILDASAVLDIHVQINDQLQTVKLGSQSN